MFAIGDDALAAIDRLELSGPRVGAELAVIDRAGRVHGRFPTRRANPPPHDIVDPLA